jgi:cyclic pyranopterin phosphate synthase
MPPEGVPLRTHNDMLTYDEIVAFSRLAVSRGVYRIRITGGEPLVRKGVEELIAMLAEIEGVVDIALTTNGQLLKEKAALLKAAGLHRVNISLDTLHPERYRIITRGGDIRKTLEGIRAAKEAGLEPVKINCVIDIEESLYDVTPFDIQDGDAECQKRQVEIHEPDAVPKVPQTMPQSAHAIHVETMRHFAQKEGLQIRFIHRMSLAHGTFSVVEGGTGGDCTHCNRLRLTADGKLKPCLFSNLEYSIRAMGHTAALEAALHNKPQRGTHNSVGSFYEIGG